MPRTSAAPSERTRVKRMHERGAYDRASIDAILDAQPLAHIAYVLKGAPFVTPTLQWREGDHVYWHGSAASRMIETCIEADVCVTVTLMDGLVLARSAYNHSVNYRSVMLLGRARLIADPAEKEARLKNFVEGMFPGRWDRLRPMTAYEAKATTVLTIEINEASAKIRSGPPGDPDEDLAQDVWAGVLPLETRTLPPIPDARGSVATPPEYLTRFKIG
ncbi:MAG: pyridoxamine 5'-phosphate oxidase family protein [Roseomonas sp.]|nr:pyridoxamine 5'-phosphate oxidase family protein [Roseomonas sp.]MCA3316250.1 pyridoxamine 5'-phosphate oxidase family protein [Roseomonas sp.]MCA3318748.1 pyridoxamine 5'-phosphate oxidase family protein [Roseomonas sp.]